MASDSGRYFVNVKTGEVEMAVFFDTQQKPYPAPNYSSKTNPTSLIQNTTQFTIDNMYQIAEEKARRNYKNFATRTMVLTETRIIDHGTAGKMCYFTWREKINDLLLPNMIDISINPENGKIISYIGIDQPVHSNVIPTISKEYALSKAIDAFSPITVEKSNSVLAIIPIYQNHQQLVRVTKIYGTPKDFIKTGGQVLVDAHTGNIMTVNSFT